MEILTMMPYVGIATLISLLVLFEVKYRQGGNASSVSGYTYYTPNNNVVIIRRILGSHYKVYVNDICPVPVKHDRFGDYFTLNAHSASDAELQIDELYRA